MRPFTAMLWKEMSESRWALYVPLLLMLLFTALASRDDYFDAAGELASLLMVMLPVALMVGVGAACRDLGGFETFWRSRPMRIGQFTLAKYATGLGIVLLALLIASLPTIGTVLIKMHTYSGGTYLDAMIVGSFLLVAVVYSMSFVIGALVQRPHHAAILAITATLGVLFVPMIVPPLSTLGFISQIEEPIFDNPRWSSFAEDLLHLWTWNGQQVGIRVSFVVYCLAMVGLIVIAAAIACVAIKRRWHVALDQKLMCWMLGGVVVLMLAVTGWQIGSNLEPARVIELPGPGNQFVLAMAPGSDGQALVVTAQNMNVPRRPEQTSLLLHMVDPDAADPIPAHPRQFIIQYQRPSLEAVCINDSRGSFAYVLAHEQNAIQSPDTLYTINMNDRQPRPDHVLELPTDNATILGTIDDELILANWGEVIRVDLSAPAEPRVVARYSDSNLYRALQSNAQYPRRVTYPIPDVPLLRQHDAMLMRYILTGRNSAVELPHAVVGSNDRFDVYRMIERTGDRAIFERIATRRNTPLERTGSNYARNITLHEGLLYETRHMLQETLTVFDLRNPARPRKLGHFVQPHQWLTHIAPLSGGRVLVGGQERLYVFDLLNNRAGPDATTPATRSPVQ